MIDAFRRSSAARITAVLPYFGYARQDRKDKPRVPISAKLVANVLSAAGTNRVLTMDLHKAQIQGFFDIPVDHLFAAPVIIDYLQRLSYPKLTMVSPDAGGAERARAYAKRLNAELAIIDKRRTDDGTAEVMNVNRRRRGAHLRAAGRHHRHGRHDHQRRQRAEGERRRARDRLRGARRALGRRDRSESRGSPIDKLDRDQHDPAVGGGAGVEQGPCPAGGAAARPGESSRFTRRRRSRRYSCRGWGLAARCRATLSESPPSPGTVRGKHGSSTRCTDARHVRKE